MPTPDLTALRAQILRLILELADPATGSPPSKRRFEAETGISSYRLERCFASWDAAVATAGLTPRYDGRPLSAARLLADYGQAVRTCGGPPTLKQYEHQTRHHRQLVLRRFGPWAGMPETFRSFAATDPTTDWSDVLQLLDATAPPADPLSLALPSPEGSSPPPSPRPAPATRAASSVCGAALSVPGFVRAPLNEQGVVMLFARLAPELGFEIVAAQTAFPDCEALRQVAPGRWQRVRIEFEFESRNFLQHGHPVEGCDLIVCWRHNWADCPPELEVLELRKLVGGGK